MVDTKIRKFNDAEAEAFTRYLFDESKKKTKKQLTLRELIEKAIDEWIMSKVSKE